MPLYFNGIRELRTLKDKIESAIQDESAAVPMYDEMARMAGSVGAPNMAQTIRRIRDQEMTHYQMFIEMNARIDEELRKREATENRGRYGY